MLNSLCERLLAAVLRTVESLDEWLEKEPPASVGKFLAENSELFSVLVVISVVGVALPEFLDPNSRQFAFGTLGAVLMVLVVIGVLTFKMILQAVHAFGEEQYPRLILYYTLSIGTLLLATAIAYASLQYQTVLYEIVDLLLFSFLLFAFGSLWISTRGQGQEHPIFWVCFTLGAFTALALSGFDVYTVRPPEALNDAYYTFTVLSTVAEVAVITLGYFVVAIVLKKGIEAYREDQREVTQE